MEGKEFEVIEGISEVLRSGQKEYQALATPASSAASRLGWGAASDGGGGGGGV